MRKLLLLLLLLPVVFAQQSCDPKQCSANSQATGTVFCRFDDLYAQYVEYYCSGNECVSRVTDRLIEDCQFGCIGTCITCNPSECEAKSAYYGNSYCMENNVYRTYRQYYCETNKGCVYTESQRLNESCDTDSTCSQGKCGLCDPLECNTRDGFYDDNFCVPDGNVYREYRDYYCTKDKCIFSLQNIKVADCLYACRDGECELPSCIACDSKDASFGQPYCKGNSVYRAFRDYFCGGIKCEFNETEKKLEDCSECKDGKCVITKAKNERMLEFDVTFSNESVEHNITFLPQRIFNGLLFGSNGIKIEANAFVKYLRFSILDTNKLGELSVFADNQWVFATTNLGSHKIEISKRVRLITISSSSSGLIFWMPAVYDLGIAVATVTDDNVRRNEFSFSLAKNEYLNLKSAEIVSWPSSTRITLNGRVLESNIIDKNYISRENKIEFLSLINETFSRKAVLKIVYEK